MQWEIRRWLGISWWFRLREMAAFSVETDWRILTIFQFWSVGIREAPLHRWETSRSNRARWNPAEKRVSHHPTSPDTTEGEFSQKEKHEIYSVMFGPNSIKMYINKVQKTNWRVRFIHLHINVINIYFYCVWTKTLRYGAYYFVRNKQIL